MFLLMYLKTVEKNMFNHAVEPVLLSRLRIEKVINRDIALSA